MPRAGVEPARPFSGKRRILSPQCLPISPSGRRLLSAHLRCSVTRAAHVRNALRIGSKGRLHTRPAPPIKKGSRSFPCKYGAGKESRTLDLNLGKVALYQLSYSRVYAYLMILNHQASYCISNFSDNTHAIQKIHHPSPCAAFTGLFIPRGLEALALRSACSGGAVRSRTGLTGFAIRGITALLPRQKFAHNCKKGKRLLPFLKKWSGKRVSNSRPQPWQGCALPTELFPHFNFY